MGYTLHHHTVFLIICILYHCHLARQLIIMELNQQWQACVEAFLHSFSRSGSQESATYYRAMLNLFFRNLKRQPEHVTRSDIEDFMWLPNQRGKRNQGARPAPGTRNVRLSVVASFYKYASDYVPPNEYRPIFEGRLPTTGIRQAMPDRAYRGMTVEDVQRFFGVIDRTTVIGLRDYALFLTLYLTARRLREICDLRYGDIVSGTLVEGETRRQAWIYTFRGKGAKSQLDSAELSHVAKEAIDAYLEASGRLPLAPDDPIFVHAHERVNADPYKAISSNAVETRFKMYRDYAGLARRLTPHSLRHASAQHRLESGSSVMEINRLLRHKSLDVTKRYAQGLLSEADPGLRELEQHFQD